MDRPSLAGALRLRDEAHLWSAPAYVSLNPVRERLVERAQDWPWSSARAHLSGRPDGMTTLAPALERVGDFAAFLGMARKSLDGRSAGLAFWIHWRQDWEER